MPRKTFLFNRRKQQRFRLNGILPSLRLPRKEKLRQEFRDHKVLDSGQLPPKVDLRPDMTAVEDQSKIGSCTANSLAGAYEYLTKKANGRNTDVSRLFIYYNARDRNNSGQPVSDTGCSMTHAIEALEKYGTCRESLWPYDISRVNVRPDQSVYEEAQNYQLEDALQVNVDLEDMKSCLAQGYPFAFGLKLYTSFDKAAKTGVVAMPDSWEASRQSHGNHALLAVGFSDESRAFIVRNSWGERWGDKGYCYIPYDYLSNSDYCFDVWSIRRLENDDLGHDNWDYNDGVDYRQAPSKDTADNYDDDDDDDNDNDENHTIEDLDEDDDDYNDGQGGNRESYWSEFKQDGDSSSYSYSYSSYQTSEYSSDGPGQFHHRHGGDHHRREGSGGFEHFHHSERHFHDFPDD
ncbi:unnamed protein product [Adineta ricciae]|uniref:Peptidase C1A papain C-terminal domain-containing protein n=1 Tax=Adineta ricciae TaxID=249248 RepID=A0A814AXQ7_ADIRI|nr:unnamed protein product [Adineta ricciae]